MSLVFLLLCLPPVSMVTITTERRDVRTLTGGGASSAAAAANRDATLLLLTGYKRPLSSGPRAAPKTAEVEDGDEDAPAVAELPPKPLPQTMLPRNMTADALKPPLGAAQVAPPPRQLVDVDVCRYDQSHAASILIFFPFYFNYI